MMPFDKCPVCGGELVEKEVEKIVRGGVNTAILTVRAEVCLHCGERLYSEGTVRRFEHIRNQLARQDTSNLRPLGVTYQAGNELRG
ncbi:MAG: YgiT-type zinc finger protein [Deltaproteobacteria bacterium]|nr:YgiT-type zinc finger protein [Deltaproteobacteria bacterium]